MNNYYPYGYSPYPGQPPPQPYAYPTAPPFPAQPYPPPAPNNAFDAQPHFRDTYDQSQHMIPGLGYGQPTQTFGWQQPIQPPPAPEAASLAQPPLQYQQQQQQQQQWPSRDEPKLIPAAQYYRPKSVTMEASKARALASTRGAPQPAPKQSHNSTNSTEEGELSEGEFDDLYEPADTIMDTSPRRPAVASSSATTAKSRTGNGNAAPTWAQGPEHKRAQSPAAFDAAARDRSGSYSPYLSPREMNSPFNVNNGHRQISQQAQLSNGQAVQSSSSATASLGLEDARKQARAAILNLWPMNVRYQQYVDEGIDATVVRNLFSELGLDASTPNQASGPGVSAASATTTSHSPSQTSFKAPGGQASVATVKPGVQEQALASTAKSAGEERKDRIARLLAAKNAKAAPSSSTAASAEAKAAQASGMTDKEAVQQQKMDALQKSREARAQKDAVRKNSVQTVQSANTSPAATRPSSATNGTSTVPATAQSPQSSLPQGQYPLPTAAPATTIPGLFMSTPQAAASNQRKRPVAADFVASSQANKRPFGHQRQDKPFVIDVSDASDDEDIEMEITSPTEESSSFQQANTPLQKTASFRNFPPLTDGRPQVSPVPSNVTTPQSGIIAAQPKAGHLENMDKKIEAMKRKIALAEAKAKLKAAMSGQASGLKSNGQTPDATADSDGSKPAIRRVQSMGASSASEQPNPNAPSSPVVAEAGSSMRLPKPSERRAEAASVRAQKFREVSTSLPLVEGRLKAKKSKLRLLQSQIARLQKEIEEEGAEKEKLTQEMEQLNQDSDESGDPQSLPKSNSVDPVATQTLVGPQSDVQADVPATDTAVLASSPVTSALSSIEAPKPQPPVAQSIEDSSIAAQADVAATGKAATNPPDVPDATVQAVPAPIEAPVNPVTSTNAVQELRPVSSSSDGPSDVVMGESSDSSSQHEEHIQDGDQECSSDAYEPSEAVAPPNDARSPSTSPVPAGSTVSLANSDADPQEPSSRASQIPEQISLGVNELTPEQGVEATREAPQPTQSADEMPSEDVFTPYESPLQYFRAYRYHPNFAETVAGGLRSLTYSNRIDPDQPVCPDQLASRECPRGADCIYQHFETMKLPDDQILLQLGGTKLDGDERNQFNDGLRKVLQDMRAKNIRDFPSIARGIVEYHKSFNGDPSKILPLGNVSL
ncbi:Protein red1 [Colletotrichum aenigma]|uniref:Protein red1 n=1 Tax=Colletotrichum aenigma TaxID=1215731 RepID=UPI0018731686|nr:Protein red1 [Colletotrichum aenigma]KAF5512208.1 Protein red1 [Colletotrichum aenigma]